MTKTIISLKGERGDNFELFERNLEIIQKDRYDIINFSEDLDINILCDIQANYKDCNLFEIVEDNLKYLGYISDGNLRMHNPNNKVIAADETISLYVKYPFEGIQFRGHHKEYIRRLECHIQKIEKLPRDFPSDLIPYHHQIKDYLVNKVVELKSIR